MAELVEPKTDVTSDADLHDEAREKGLSHEVPEDDVVSWRATARTAYTYVHIQTYTHIHIHQQVCRNTCHVRSTYIHTYIHT